MQPPQKNNIARFNADVKTNEGYRYTTNAGYSCRVANLRITEAIASGLRPDAIDVLDIGCGDGTFTGELSRRFPRMRFTGLDAAAAALEIARRNHPGIEFTSFDLMDPSTFPDRRFDAAVIRGVLHHLPDAAQGLLQAARLSDRLIIIEPNGNNPILKWIEKHSRYHIEHEEQSFSHAQLRAWCKLAGMRVARLEYIGFIPMFFPSLPAHIIHFMQPVLELIPGLGKYFGAQILLVCEKE